VSTFGYNRRRQKAWQSTIIFGFGTRKGGWSLTLANEPVNILNRGECVTPFPSEDIAARLQPGGFFLGQTPQPTHLAY
jgi:hypothetical protein